MHSGVFSTYVEMILRCENILRCATCVLHVCGDDPKLWLNCILPNPCSPRMWRWSYLIVLPDQHDIVFSTYVEMILNFRDLLFRNICVLHVCGDDPMQWFWRLTVHLCSPRMWRWSYAMILTSNGSSVFSTYVEMIPLILLILFLIRGVLHVCGDDPIWSHC